jgi:hypothetical protein
MVWPDAGAGPAETIAACRADWLARWSERRFRRHVARNGFRLVLLAADSRRAVVLRNELEKHRWPPRLHLVVETMPGLRFLTNGSR